MPLDRAGRDTVPQVVMDHEDTDRILGERGFGPRFSLGTTDWNHVPDTPGVYVIFEGQEPVYVGMAGRDQKGSLRRRLRDHASGQIVNMFAQYLLFARILAEPNRPRTPREAALACRAYIRARCTARVLSLVDRAEASRIERELRAMLRPTFNAMDVPRQAASGTPR